MQIITRDRFPFKLDYFSTFFLFSRSERYFTVNNDDDGNRVGVATLSCINISNRKKPRMEHNVSNVMTDLQKICREGNDDQLV